MQAGAQKGPQWTKGKRKRSKDMSVEPSGCWSRGLHPSNSQGLRVVQQVPESGFGSFFQASRYIEWVPPHCLQWVSRAKGTDEVTPLRALPFYRITSLKFMWHMKDLPESMSPAPAFFKCHSHSSLGFQVLVAAQFLWISPEALAPLDFLARSPISFGKLQEE